MREKMADSVMSAPATLLTLSSLTAVETLLDPLSNGNRGYVPFQVLLNKTY